MPNRARFEALLAPEPPPHDRALQLASILRNVITYTNTDNRVRPADDTAMRGLISSSTPSDLFILENLEKVLDRDFYSQLYVPRPEEERLKSSLRNDGTVFVIGYAGCGKSTILRKIKRDIPLSAEASITHIDVANNADRFVNLSTCREHLSVAIYNDIFKNVLPHIYSPSFLPREYQAFRLCNTTTAEHTLLSERAQRDHFLSDQQAWREYLRCNPDFADEESNLWTSGTILPTTRLFALLGFLVFLGHRATIIFDNVDRHTTPIQEEISTFAEDLGKGTPAYSYPIVSVRTDNYRLLTRRASEDLKIELSKNVNPDILGDFITRRIDYAISYMNQFPALQPSSIRSTDGTVACFSRDTFYEAVKRFLCQPDILSHILKMHNDSLRCAGHDVNDIFDICCVRRAPFSLSPAFVDSLLGDRDFSQRQLRTQIYRQFALEGHELAIPDIFSFSTSLHGDTSSGSSFLALKMLIYMDRQNGPVRGLDILKHFSFLGISPRQLVNTAKILAMPSGTDVYGLIHIDLSGDKWNDMDQTEFSTHNIDIFPRGKFVLDTLGPQCEYVFWVAIFSDTRAVLWPSRCRQDRVRDYLEDDSFRGCVALKYLRLFVVQPFFDELCKVAQSSIKQKVVDGKTLLTRYTDVTQNRAGKWYLEGVVESIDSFVRNSLAEETFVDGGFRSECFSLADQIKKLLAEASQVLNQNRN